KYRIEFEICRHEQLSIMRIDRRRQIDVDVLPDDILKHDTALLAADECAYIVEHRRPQRGVERCVVDVADQLRERFDFGCGHDRTEPIRVAMDASILSSRHAIIAQPTSAFD